MGHTKKLNIMRPTLFFTIFLLFCLHGMAQELTGPDHISSGTLASFEIVPAQEASWHIVSPSSNTAIYQVDTGSSKLYFASPERGTYTVVAGIVTNGKPQLLVKTFFNGEEETIPLPVSSLETWIKTQAPNLVRSKNFVMESRLVADCFEKIVRRIDEQTITTAQNARTQLQITLAETLALASPTAVTDWAPFIMELSRRLEQELGDKINDLTEVKRVIQSVSDTLKSPELPKGVSILPSVDDPNVRSQGTQNRIFRHQITK
jgi:hypothetical protein